MTGAFILDALAPEHDRQSFSCGVPALDRYLATQAGQDTRRLFAKCYVAIDKRSGRIAGYYTLSATRIPIDELPEDVRRRLPRYPAVPASLIGRLAIDSSFQGQGLGKAMLTDAVRRSLRSESAAFAMVAEAKDDNAVGFYRHYDFLPFVSQPRTLFLPLAPFAKLRGMMP